MGYIFEALNRAAGDSPPVEPEADTCSPVGPKLLLVDPSEQVAEPVANSPGEDPVMAGPDRLRPSHVKTDVYNVNDRLIAVTDPASIMAEQYRSIRKGLFARWEQRRHRATESFRTTGRHGEVSGRGRRYRAVGVNPCEGG